MKPDTRDIKTGAGWRKAIEAYLLVRGGDDIGRDVLRVVMGARRKSVCCEDAGWRLERGNMMSAMKFLARMIGQIP